MTKLNLGDTSDKRMTEDNITRAAEYLQQKILSNELMHQKIP
jgi:hypothetical protein